ncbi:MAG: hypothetical protein K8Q89_03420 [Nitrosarchaeum sp.]|nr:hypothetical protein [Nitrosarchaeum sp.]
MNTSCVSNEKDTSESSNKTRLQVSLDNKIGSDNKTSFNKKYPNTIDEYDRLNGEFHIDRSFDKKDCKHYNLDYRDELNNHCITNFAR